MRFDLQGTAHQVSIVQAALDRCDFPWNRVEDRVIPVEWADLSVYEERVVYEMTEDHGHPYEITHDHDGEWDPMIRMVGGRERILGLAWYSGKVSLDLSLENNVDLAYEVFLSELAHMIDFFWMDDRIRVVVWNQAHREHPEAQLPPDANIEDATVLDPDHPEHGWFDVGGYYGWVGEWWMGAFVLGWSTGVPVTITFDHPLTTDKAMAIRFVIAQKFIEDAPLEPSPPLEPEIPEIPTGEGCVPRWLQGLVRPRSR